MGLRFGVFGLPSDFAFGILAISTIFTQSHLKSWAKFLMMHSTSGSWNFAQDTRFLLFLLAKFSRTNSLLPSITHHFNVFTVYLTALERWLSSGNLLPLSALRCAHQPTRHKLPEHSATGDKCTCRKFQPLPPILRNLVCASHFDSSRIVSICIHLPVVGLSTCYVFCVCPCFCVSLVKHWTFDALPLPELFPLLLP